MESISSSLLLKRRIFAMRSPDFSKELHQLDTFYNALNINDQDSLNSAAGGNFLDKMPRECLKIIESKSKVRQTRAKAVVAKVSTNSSTQAVSSDVAELKDIVRALLLDKKNQASAPAPAPAPVKAVELSCVTCGGAHSHQNCPATHGNVYRDNISEYVSQAAAANYNQIGQLTKEFHAKTVSYMNNSSFDQCKAVYDDKEAPLNNKINEPHEVYFVSDDRTHVVQEEDLGASINVIPKSMFEHLKLSRLAKTYMLVEMADMIKRAPIGIVENILIKIDKFLFPSNSVVIDMLKTRNKTVILGRPFLATIHAEIDVFNKEISLGIGDDRVTFDMNRKVNNFKTSVGIMYIINSNRNGEPSSSSDTPTDGSSRVEKSDDLIQKHDNKKTRILKHNTHIPSAHFYKPIKQIYNGTLRKSIRGSGLSFPEFLLVRYGETQGNDLIWDKRYAELYTENSSQDTPTSKFTSIYEGYKPRPKDYPFMDWLLTKLGHTDWMFELEIDQLADEYELGIGKKGHMLDDIWENCKKVQGDNTYWWYDQKSEEDERREMGTDIEGKELMDALPLGRENKSRFIEMIRKEVDSGRKVLSARN
ncbi:reverse transcriptase domain-containing protein [Tanacetum coccineum]